jgi:hypothetical protein
MSRVSGASYVQMRGQVSRLPPTISLLYPHLISSQKADAKGLPLSELGQTVISQDPSRDGTGFTAGS